MFMFCISKCLNGENIETNFLGEGYLKKYWVIENFLEKAAYCLLKMQTFMEILKIVSLKTKCLRFFYNPLH